MPFQRRRIAVVVLRLLVAIIVSADVSAEQSALLFAVVGMHELVQEFGGLFANGTVGEEQVLRDRSVCEGCP